MLLTFEVTPAYFCFATRPRTSHLCISNHLFQARYDYWIAEILVFFKIFYVTKYDFRLPENVTTVPCFLAISSTKKAMVWLELWLRFFFSFFSAINVANVSNEVLHFPPISLFIRTLDPFPVNTAGNAFIKSQTWKSTLTFTPVSFFYEPAHPIYVWIKDFFPPEKSFIRI